MMLREGFMPVMQSISAAETNRQRIGDMLSSEWLLRRFIGISRLHAL